MIDYGTMADQRYDEESEERHQTQMNCETPDEENDIESSTAPNDVSNFLSSGCYFKDGTKKIDFVLVYETDVLTTEERRHQNAKSSRRSLIDKLESKRLKFKRNLQRRGIDIEEEQIESAKKLINYWKLHIPNDVLYVHAEDMLLRAPLQLRTTSSLNPSEPFLSLFRLPNIMKISVPNEPLFFYSCHFKRSKISRFRGGGTLFDMFNTRDRQRVAYEILAKTAYGKKSLGEIGIDRLIEDEVFNAAFPLHDGNYRISSEPSPIGSHGELVLNKRQVLYGYWAKWSLWYKYQPLDHIREYFGEKIGIYFAWLGFYTAWLLPASVVGVFVFLFGLCTMNSNTEAQEICDSGALYKMCPVCDTCHIWVLSENCIFSRVAYLFDHPGTVFYSVFMSFWAVAFLEFWKRKTADLSHRWECVDFQDEEERPRPEYAAKCKAYEKNPVTGIKEPFFPPRKRISRTISGFSIILFMMSLVIIFIVAVILYRILITIPLSKASKTLFHSQASTVASISASVVNLIIILALGKVYQKLAFVLTKWEMHRTQSEFEDQLIFKVFIFQFVNFYSSIIYIGFFKGKFAGYPGHYSTLFGVRQEECQAGSCLTELAQQLTIIMIGKQAINNCQEILLPKLRSLIHRWKIGKKEGQSSKQRWEEDYELIENEGLFDEYLEMILQFGFITIFVAAFPLAPLFALINNWMEIRLDAQKFVCETRRPVAEPCQNIGVWFTILEAIAHLAVISNAFLIAFTSEFLPKQLYQYKYNSLRGYVNFTLSWAVNGTTSEPCRFTGFRDENGTPTQFYWELLCVRLGFVIVFEHVVFGICKLIDILVPDIPKSLDLKMKRERYLAKQALTEVDVESLILSDEQTEPEDRQILLDDQLSIEALNT